MGDNGRWADRRTGGEGRTGNGRGARTRQALVAAAVAVLAEDGFHAASARAVAARAGCNQALVFYHFGSVADLLLAALDAVADARRARYEEILATVSGPAGLLALAATVFEEDLDAGHTRVLAEMLVGSQSNPALAQAVAARLAWWEGFARRALEAGLGASPVLGLVPADAAAHGLVALFLGLELLGHLDGDRDRARSLFRVGAQAALDDTTAGR